MANKCAIHLQSHFGFDSTSISIACQNPWIFQKIPLHVLGNNSDANKRHSKANSFHINTNQIDKRSNTSSDTSTPRRGGKKEALIRSIIKLPSRQIFTTFHFPSISLTFFSISFLHLLLMSVAIENSIYRFDIHIHSRGLAHIFAVLLLFSFVARVNRIQISLPFRRCINIIQFCSLSVSTEIAGRAIQFIEKRKKVVNVSLKRNQLKYSHGFARSINSLSSSV